jgi:hypothetical protein
LARKVKAFSGAQEYDASMPKKQAKQDDKPEHVHVETGADKCLSYQVETTLDAFESALSQASQRVEESEPSRTKESRRKTKAR